MYNKKFASEKKFRDAGNVVFLRATIITIGRTPEVTAFRNTDQIKKESEHLTDMFKFCVSLTRLSNICASTGHRLEMVSS